MYITYVSTSYLENIMLAGDSLLVLALLIWLTFSIGPWWLGVSIFALSTIIQFLHKRYLMRARIRSLEKLSSELNMPIPDSIKAQIIESQKNFWNKLG